MRQEILEVPTAVARIVESGAADIQLAAAALRTHDPQFFSVWRAGRQILDYQRIPIWLIF
tara:strand:+ start:287 stop:466 length:180 start_codon:yes stop_codon:yes gene_type:complete